MTVLRVFGSVELLGAEGTPDLSMPSQPKRTALLVYLALARPRGFHRREKLLALFWPESDNEHARAALSSSLTFLRRSVGEELILTRGNEEVGLDRTLLGTDVEAFEGAVEAGDPETALEHYRGHLMEGFFLSGCPEFEVWLEEERERLRELAAGAAWELAQRQIASGELVAAERTAQRALRWVPTDESPVRTFIEALAIAGDRAASVRFYEKFSRVLREELELEPSAETAAVVERIRADSGLDTERGPGLRVSAPVEAAVQPQAPSSDVTSPPPVPSEDRLVAGGGRSAVRRRPRVLGPVVGVVGIAVALAIALWLRSPSGPAEETVVVLPLENLTGDPSLDSYSDWAVQFIAEGLGDVGLAQIVSFWDVFRLAEGPNGEGGTPRSLYESWPERTGATLAIGGAYNLLPPGDSVEFRLRVIDPRGKIRQNVVPIRAALADPREGLGRLEVQAVGAVAGIVRPGHEREITAKGRYPPKLEAHRAMMEAWLTFTNREFEASIPGFEEAMRLDSTYFYPLILLLSAYDNLGRPAQADSVCGVMKEKLHLADRVNRLTAELLCPDLRPPGRTRVEISRDRLAFGKAAYYLHGLALLDSNQPREASEAFAKYDTARGVIFREWESINNYLWAMSLHLLGEHSRELELLQEARLRFPDEFRLVNQELAALIALGRHDEALRLIDDQLDLGPPGQSTANLLIYAGAEFDAHGNPELARDVWQRALEWLEGRPLAELATGPNRRTRVLDLLYLERLPEAEDLMGGLMAEAPDNVSHVRRLGILRAMQGNRNAAEEISARLAAWEGPLQDGLASVWRAEIAAQLGDSDRAVRLLHQAMEEGWRVKDSPHRDAFLRPLRGYPPFEEFVRPKG